MKPASTPLVASNPAEFADGLGVRVRLAEKGGEELTVLRLAPEFVAVPAFEFALRERANRLADFRHGAYARVRRVDRFEGGAVLGIVSEHALGQRLSTLLAAAEQLHIDYDTNAALCVLRQLVPAVAVLHQFARDVSHGALAPERLLSTPDTRVVVTDYVLGAAIDQLRLSRDRLWRDLRIAVPPGAGSPRLDHRSDMMQVGVIALSLLLGRNLQRDELRSILEVLSTVTERIGKNERAPLGPELRRWLLRMLQVEPRGSFASAVEAQDAFEAVLASEPGYTATPAALDAFLARCREGIAGSDKDRVSTSEPPPLLAPVPVATPPPPVSGRAMTSVLKPVVVAPSATKHVPPPAAVVTAKPAAVPPSVAPSVQKHIAPDTDLAHEPIRNPLDIQPLADPPQSAAPTPPRSGRHRVASGVDAGPVAESLPLHPPRAVRPREVDEGTFAFERSLQAAKSRRRRVWQWIEHVALVIAVLAAVGEFAIYKFVVLAGKPIPGATGMFVVDSRPSGVEVLVDGTRKGTTPLSLELKGGSHVLELRAGPRSRVLPITIKNGETVSHYVELSSGTMTGMLDVRRAPGARVRVDGVVRGTSPLKVFDLVPGSHELLLESHGSRIRQSVQVQPGVMVIVAQPGDGPPARAKDGDGWLDVKAPYEMEVYENGRLIGSTTSGRLPLAAGPHALDIASEALGYRTSMHVAIARGEVTPVNLVLPMGTLTVQSDVPADVLIDGVNVGTTPISSLAMAIGPHQVTFLHPQFGKQQRAVTVTASSPVTVAVTFKAQ